MTRLPVKFKVFDDPPVPARSSNHQRWEYEFATLVEQEIFIGVREVHPYSREDEPSGCSEGPHRDTVSLPVRHADTGVGIPTQGASIQLTKARVNPIYAVCGRSSAEFLASPRLTTLHILQEFAHFGKVRRHSAASCCKLLQVSGTHTFRCYAVDGFCTLLVGRLVTVGATIRPDCPLSRGAAASTA